MPVQRHRDRTRQAGDREAQADGEPPVRSEDLHVRNYDVHASHTVEVTIYDDSAPAGRQSSHSKQVAFAARYHLHPGQAESECDALEAGTYVVEVRCDGVQRERERCTVSENPQETAMIELGNGAVSVTETVY
jgi:hypothetical protein